MKVLYVLIVLAVLIGCKKKVQPEFAGAQIACDCISEVSADFYMEEMLGTGQSWGFYTNTDTIWPGKNVRFRALEENAEVTWYLGIETASGQEAFRNFGENLMGQSLPVICVVKKKPNLKCFPNDDGYDSIVKYIHVANHNQRDSSYLLEGVFRVKEKNSPDSIDLTVVFRHTSVYPMIIDLYNYDGQGNDDLNNITYKQNYREIQVDLNAHSARIIHQLSGKVTIDIIGNDDTFPTFFYSGRKL